MKVNTGGPPVEVKPGRLMSSLSSDAIGVANYSIKREFRRVIERDVRSEGYEWYRPNTATGSISKLLQSIPTGSTEPITLISECALGNGRIALVAGNGTTLWRYWGLEDPEYYDTEDNSTYYEIEPSPTGPNFVPNGATYVPGPQGSYELSSILIPGTTYIITWGSNELSIYINGVYYNASQATNGVTVFTVPAGSPGSVTARLIGSHTGAVPVTAAIQIPVNNYYYDENAYGWVQIAAGLNSNGLARRWESVQVADYLVLNNGVDLPLTYNLQEVQAYPIYELREQQIAAVGTIAAHAGILCCADIYQIQDQAFLDIMTPISSAAQASQDNTGQVTPNLTFFYPVQTAAFLFPGLLYQQTGNPICQTGNSAGAALVPPPTSIGVVVASNPFTNEQVVIIAGQGFQATMMVVNNGSTPQMYWLNAPGDSPQGTQIPTGVNVYATAYNAAAIAGLTLFWGNGNQSLITGINVAGNIVTSNTTVIAATSVALENAAAYALFDCTQDNYENFQRYPWRFFPSMPSLPRRFGASVPVAFTASPGYPDDGYGANIGTLLYPVRSIPELINSNQAANHTQESFVISGIGTAGGNLTADIYWTYPGITQTVFISQPAVTTQPAFDTATDLGSFIEAADAQASFAGVFEDLQDDDSAIIKMLTLRDQIVVYKETPVVFIASYTGDLNTPFQFQKVIIANAAQSLKYRNTLIAQGGGYFGSYHLYAGEDAFYKFDLFQLTPTELPVLELCQDVFFKNAQDPENCFAAENPLTREIYLCFGTSTDGSDNALCYDYKYLTARTTQFPISAAARARNPVDRTYWFVMGMVDGSVKRYGLYDAATESSGVVTAMLAYTNSFWTVTASEAFFTPAHVGMTIEFSDGTRAAVQDLLSPTQVTLYFVPTCSTYTGFTTGQTFKMLPGMWHVDGATYESTLQSGLDAFGFTHGQKMLNEYVLFCSSKYQNSSAMVEFEAGVNPEKRAVIQSATIECPDTHNLLNPTVQDYYLGITLTVNGMNDPIAIVNQLFNVLPVATHSFGRQP